VSLQSLSGRIRAKLQISLSEPLNTISAYKQERSSAVLSMSFKKLFGLEDSPISEGEIMGKIRDAMNARQRVITFTTRSGSSVTVQLPERNFSSYIDPWDGKNKANYPRI
jgi:hypothetical protein